MGDISIPQLSPIGGANFPQVIQRVSDAFVTAGKVVGMISLRDPFLEVIEEKVVIVNVSA